MAPTALPWNPTHAPSLLPGRVLLSCVLSVCLWCEATVFGQDAAEATSSWKNEFQLGRFQIHCDFELATKEQLLGELQSISQDLEKLLKIPQQTSKIHIVLFSTEKEYRRYMQNYFPDVPNRRAVFLQDRGPGMLFAYLHSDIETDLRHEVTHALLNSGPHPLPLWLDEGLAEYFENPPNLRFRGNKYAEQIGKQLDELSMQNIPQLESQKSIQDLSNADYRDSWAWVHFMIHRSPDTRLALIRFLEMNRNRQPSHLSLQRALQHACPDLQAEFRHHFQQLRPVKKLAKASKPRL